MKSFLKVFSAILAVFGAAIAALVIFDKFSNKNRLKGDYLECDVENGDEDEEIVIED